MDLIKVVNEAFATKKEFPAFKSGDTITVATVCFQNSLHTVKFTVLLLAFQ